MRLTPAQKRALEILKKDQKLTFTYSSKQGWTTVDGIRYRTMKILEQLGLVKCVFRNEDKDVHRGRTIYYLEKTYEVA